MKENRGNLLNNETFIHNIRILVIILGGLDMRRNNHRCPCGSGRRYKKCCANKNKDRVTSLTMDMGEPTIVNGYEIDADGNFVLLKDGQPVIPQKASITSSIPRENKKDKVTLNVPINNVKKLNVDSMNEIINLNHLFIIDTNTINPTSILEVNVTSASAVQHFKVQNNNLLLIDQLGKVFKHEVGIHGEKLALIDLISYIMYELKLNSDELIGIVTDHDLGNHEKYNTREIPLIHGTEYFLPENVSFIYASADKKNESLLNQLISECDKGATSLLDEMKKS